MIDVILKTMRGNYRYHTRIFKVWRELILERRRRFGWHVLNPRIYLLQHLHYHKYTVDLKRAASKDSISERVSYYFNMNSDLRPTGEKEQTEFEI